MIWPKGEYTIISKPKYIVEQPLLAKMPEYSLVSSLSVKDMEPWIRSKNYIKAHQDADYWENKVFSKTYKELDKLAQNLPNNVLLGANDPKGNLFVSKKVPVKLRQEAAYHEWVESLARKKLREES